jgi:antitoxin component YwqK of YwqJK toxin-antitoxin module
MLCKCCINVILSLSLGIIKEGIMKKIVFICALFVGIFATAQDTKPTTEKLDNGLIKVTYYHTNGVVAQEGTFLDNKRHGEWISYNEQGTKTAKAEYNENQKTGKWFFWSGETLSEVDYSNNAIASVNTWVNKSAVASNKP